MDIEKIYETLISDTSIISLQQLGKIFGLGSKRRIKMTNELYNKYTKEHISSITYSRRSSQAAKKQWTTRTRIMPEEVKRKISDANKRVWEKDDGSRKEISRRNMISNAANVDKKKATQKAIETRRKRDRWAEYSPESYSSLVNKNRNKIVSEETRNKQSVSAKRRGRTLPPGFRHSDITLAKLSEKTKSLWKSGKFKRVYVSKTSQRLIKELETLGYKVECEYYISGRPFDMKIENSVIEFNGTYWHCDPRYYDAQFYDKCRKVYAYDVWKNDKEKLLLAENAGYRTYVVWQHDWETSPNEVIENVRRFIEGV